MAWALADELVGAEWQPAIQSIPALAIAGSLAAKNAHPEGPGSFPTTGGLWVGLLVGLILIIGGLTFLPSLALGPAAEQLAMLQGQLF